jgi:hypothetical protein
MKVIEGGFGNKAPSDLANVLREMADSVERGDITALVAAYVENGEYLFTYGASMSQAVVLSSMLQDQSIQRMKIYD